MNRTALHIGPHPVVGRALLAPMAGLTDQPFRNLCRRFGAATATSEMTTSDTRLWNSNKSATRLDLRKENGLRIVQIAGSEPEMMAEAGRAAHKLGADIIDINMGCPAKKVCRKLAGSALLQDESLVARILEQTVQAVPVPVTLKMRTGWNPENRNGVRIAQLAERIGIQAIAVHGRTRACMYKGDAEYETIRQIKSAVSIPVFANGDITTPETALEVLRKTGADGVMIGRGALGQPWFFSELAAKLNEKDSAEPLTTATQRDIILDHLDGLYSLYGEYRGLRVARKHLTWYCRYLEDAESYREQVVRVESVSEQLRLTRKFFDRYHN
ncbi:MAG: tRNA dihydrouridine synthase DusB [Gammaproteobacteria bacterium]